MDTPKIKITKKELEEMYDIEEVKEDVKQVEDNSNATVSFEDYSVQKDKEDDKKWRSEEDVE